MVAIVTDDLKFNVLEALLADYNAANSKYYIGLARSEQWDSNDAVKSPINSKFDETDFKERLQSVKKVEAASFVVPRQDWAYGTIYPQWDDLRSGNLSNGRRYYVLTDNYGVYICLRTGKNKQGVAQPSLVKPASSNLEPFRTGDGYIWKFLYTLSALKANYFLTSQFMPVHRQETTDSNSTGIELKQFAVQGAAVGGRITTFVMKHGGNGSYGKGTGSAANAIPSIVVRGDGELTFGDSAVLRLRATIDSAAGTVTSITTNGLNNTLNYLDSYNFAEAVIVKSGVSGDAGDSALARPVVGPKPGFGFDPRRDLKSDALMFRSKILDTDTDFITDQDFRQIALIKNPQVHDSLGRFNEITGIAMRNMKLSSYTVAFSKDKTVQGVTSNARAFIDNVDSTVADGTRIFYHQSVETGYKQLVDGEALTEIDGTGTGTVLTASNPGEINRISGDILYLDNRNAVVRSANQSEDIKVIIQL